MKGSTIPPVSLSDSLATPKWLEVETPSSAWATWVEAAHLHGGAHGEDGRLRRDVLPAAGGHVPHHRLLHDVHEVPQAVEVDGGGDGGEEQDERVDGIEESFVEVEGVAVVEIEVEDGEDVAGGGDGAGHQDEEEGAAEVHLLHGLHGLPGPPGVPRQGPGEGVLDTIVGPAVRHQAQHLHLGGGG